MRWALWLVLGFEAFYLIAANGFFASKVLQSLVSSPDGSVLFRYGSAWTPFPGRYHVSNLDLASGDSHVQWTVHVGEAWFTSNPFLLFGQRFSTSSLTGEHVGFRLRTTIAENDVARPVTADYPPIPGYDEPLAPMGPPTPPSGAKPWTIHLEGIDVMTDELWFQEFRFSGLAHTMGSFELTPGKGFWVGPATVVFSKGTVNVGGRTLASPLEGDVTCTIHPVETESVDGLEIFHYIDATSSIDAQVIDASFTRAYFPAGLRLADGSGQLKVDVAMNGGVMAPASEVSLATSHATIDDEGYGATAYGLRARWHVAASGEASSLHVVTPETTLRRKGWTGPAPRAEGLDAEMSFGTPDLAEMPWAPVEKRAALHQLALPDMRFANLEPLKVLGLEFEQGASQVRASLAADAREALSGELRVLGEGLTWQFKGQRIHAELAFEANAPKPTEPRTLAFTGMRLDLRDVALKANGEDISHWWSSAEVGPARLSFAPQPSFTGNAHLKARDAWPIVAFVLDPGGITGLIRDHIKTDPLESVVSLSAKSDDIDLRVPGAEGGPYKVAGRLRARGGAPCGAFLVSVGPLSLGTSFDGGGSHLSPLVGQDWLSEHTSETGKGGVASCSTASK